MYSEMKFVGLGLKVLHVWFKQMHEEHELCC